MMDDTPTYHHINGLAGSQAQYPAQQHQQQQHQNPTPRRFPEGGQESNTLPPINGLSNAYAMYNQNGSMLPGSAPGSMPHTPITPHSTLGGSSSAPPDANFAAQTLQHHRPIVGPPYPQQYQTSQSIAAAPSLAAAPPYGAPLAARGQYQPHLLAHNNQLKQEPEPTHVVGQQGRRGILPSAPGRAQPQAGKTAIPQKDENGKFPCPHCTKTYLHAKHLKRHMLRHTGDRPYQCKLCKDTFSRSDILKRHYQKCSIRRGVPNDTNHLEGSRNHLVKNNNNRLSNGSIGEQQHSYLNGAPSQAAFDPSLNQHQMMMHPVNQYVQNGGVYSNDMALSNRSSRANSLMSPANNRFEGQQQDYGNSATLAQMAPGVPAYSMAPSSNGYPYSIPVTAGEMNANHQVRAGESNGIFKQEQQSLAQWNGNYQSNGGGENYQIFPAGPVGGSQNLPDTKQDLAGSGQGGPYTNLYSTSSNFTANQMFDGWNLGDPFDAKAAALVAFCFADGAPSSPNEIAVHNRLRQILTADNIKRYLRLFRNFQGHWPIIHMPTFSTTTANNGLLLAMVTIGAVYADDLGLDEVRWLMELAKNAVHRSSHIYNSAASMDATHRIQPAPTDIEEMQTLALLQIIFIWHGNKQQRAKAREEFWNIAKIARQIGLLCPIPPSHQPGFSPLHSLTSKEPVHEANLDWQVWVEQEKRSRVMFTVYLLDCSLVIFFNCSPNFNSSELRLQLPCDDGAWEAPSSEAWKDSIGLHGYSAQANTNQTGSKSVSQPDFGTFVRVLLSSNTTIAPGSTNVYGKFILIHALLVKVAMPAINTIPSGTNTPLTQYDWVALTSPRQGGRLDSGRATPTEAYPQSQQAQQAHFHKQHLMNVQLAFEKWRQAWEKDMDSQYPSAGSPNGRGNVRREGFCRDAIHFYHLGKHFIQYNANLKGVTEADQRVAYVMATLKVIRTHVAQEGDRQGIELGSVVNIDESYGVDDVRLDMKLLFAPLSLDIGTEAQAITQNGGQMRLMQQQQQN